MIIFRLIVYQRWLIPLAFLVQEIKDIKEIKAAGEDGIGWYFSRSSLQHAIYDNALQIAIGRLDEKCALVPFPGYDPYRTARGSLPVPTPGGA